MITAEKLRRHRLEIVLGAWWTCFGTFFLTVGDNPYLGAAALVSAVAFFARAILPEGNTTALITAIVAMTVIAALLIWARFTGHW